MIEKLLLKPPHSDLLPQIVELDKTCLGGLWTLEGYQRELESSNSSFFILSIPLPSQTDSYTNSQEKLIGCGCFWTILEEAHITLLGIHPDYQGQGLGQLLLYTLLKDAVERKLERATLEVRISNEVALSLYEKFGFKIAGKRKKYYQKTGEDALILWRGDLQKPTFTEDLLLWKEQIDERILDQNWLLLEKCYASQNSS